MCGILGIFSNNPVATEMYDGLIHLQHRGQDATGICTYNKKFHLRKGGGYVRDVFSQADIDVLLGNWGIGHTRYATIGNARFSEEDAQPFITYSPYGIVMAHNGDLTNYSELKNELLDKNKRYCNSGCDVEIILNVFASKMQEICEKTNDIFDQICLSVDSVFDRCIGGYSVVAIVADRGMVAFRDPHGIRPLVWGTRENENGKTDYIFSSENTMYYPLGFKLKGDIAPGEVVFIGNDGTMTRRQLRCQMFTPDVFEYVYLARPDSMLNNVSVYRARARMGQNLAKKWKEIHPNVTPDIVIPVPFSSNTSALAMAHELGVRYSEGLYKNPFIGRTFIMQGQKNRQKSILQKLSPQETDIRDKKVMLVDDSIVRGNTSKKVVDLVRNAGASQVYFVSACPPVKYPDFYGIDIPTRSELIASSNNVEEIRKFIGADILLYQEIEGLVEAVTRRGEHKIHKLSMPYLDGWYVTGDIDEEKMRELEKEKKSC